jgi:Transposase DDE domain
MLESITIVTLLLYALDRVQLQEVFDRDPYESRRPALPGSRLVKVLVVYQLIKSSKLRGLVRAIEEHAGLQRVLGGAIERNTLSNALAHRSLEQMIEAWMVLWQAYAPWVAQLGQKFARIAVVDASLLRLSLQAFAWAQYRQQSGAAKMHAVLDWARGIPQQLVFTPGKVHELKGATRMAWAAHWTYVFDRAYLSFPFLAGVLEAGAHFVVRFKAGVGYLVLERREVPVAPASAGIRLTSDWTVRLPGWPAVVLRLVSYQLPDGKLIRVLSDRFDLSAASIAQLYKERWTIENWWKWIKALFKIKEPLGRSEQALPVQIIGAFVTDLLLRAFKQSSGFTSSLYEFVTRCQEASLTALGQIPKGSALRQALEVLLKLLAYPHRPLQLRA